MPNSYISDKNKYVLIVPFLYAFFSRYEWPRGFLVNMATSWIPGIILVTSLTGTDLVAGLWNFFLGYIIFISVYEIGYIANDSYGLKHDVTPRQRISVGFDHKFLAAFISVRAICLILIVTLTGLASHFMFWASYAALVTLLILHNTLHQVEFKFATFLQMSILRFVLPVLPILLLSGLGHLIPLVAISGMILFTYPRFLTYLEAKGRLNIPERKKVTFVFFTHLISTPLLALVSISWGTWAPLLVLGWLIFVQLIYIALSNLSTFSKVAKIFHNRT